jgi:ABC-type bacteriocin/lantibiotic exporter with double-glycine peptidase domain
LWRCDEKVKAGAIIVLFLGIWIAGIGAVFASDPPAIWIDVPFVSQSKEGCGSAALSMVTQYWAQQAGKPASPQMDAAKVQELLYSRRQKGIPASAMEKYLQERGYRAFAFRGEWRDLQHHLQQGRPLIVCLKASGARGPLHYAVVVGLEAGREFIFLNDPAKGKMLRMSREGFQSEWDSAKNWTLLAVPGAEN